VVRVELEGASRFSIGEARYQGPYGRWHCQLTPTAKHRGQNVLKVLAEDPMIPCTRVYGRPWCVAPSDCWRETEAQRRERLTLLFQEDPEAIRRSPVATLGRRGEEP
jgi:hypothetical protein